MEHSKYSTLKRDYLDHGNVQPELYSLLLQVVRALVPRYPPEIYSPYGKWDDGAFEDVCHDWWLGRLQPRVQSADGAVKGGRSELRYYLQTASTEESLKWCLTDSLKKHLADKRHHTEFDRLFRHTRETLERDAGFRCFVPTKRVTQNWFGLATWENPEPFAGSEANLTDIGYRVRDGNGLKPICYRQDAKKNSPILSTADLKTFLQSLLTTVDALLTLDQIGVVLRHCFGPMTFESASKTRLNGPGDVERLAAAKGGLPESSKAPSPDQALVIDEAARTVLQSLSVRQRTVFYLRVGRGNPATLVACALKCHVSIVFADIRVVATQIGRIADSSDERFQVQRRLLDLIEDSMPHVAVPLRTYPAFNVLQSETKAGVQRKSK